MNVEPAMNGHASSNQSHQKETKGLKKNLEAIPGNIQ